MPCAQDLEKGIVYAVAPLAAPATSYTGPRRAAGPRCRPEVSRPGAAARRRARDEPVSSPACPRPCRPTPCSAPAAVAQGLSLATCSSSFSRSNLGSSTLVTTAPLASAPAAALPAGPTYHQTMPAPGSSSWQTRPWPGLSIFACARTRASRAGPFASPLSSAGERSRTRRPGPGRTTGKPARRPKPVSTPLPLDTGTPSLRARRATADRRRGGPWRTDGARAPCQPPKPGPKGRTNVDACRRHVCATRRGGGPEGEQSSGAGNGCQWALSCLGGSRQLLRRGWLEVKIWMMFGKSRSLGFASGPPPPRVPQAGRLQWGMGSSRAPIDGPTAPPRASSGTPYAAPGCFAACAQRYRYLDLDSRYWPAQGARSRPPRPGCSKQGPRPKVHATSPLR